MTTWIHRSLAVAPLVLVLALSCGWRGPEWRFGDRDRPLLSGWFASRDECEAATAQYKSDGGSPTECIPVGHGVGNPATLPTGGSGRDRFDASRRCEKYVAAKNGPEFVPDRLA
jgi:hypothetical protein